MYRMFTHLGVVPIYNKSTLAVAFAVESLLDALADRNIFEADGVHEVDHLLFVGGRRFC